MTLYDAHRAGGSCVRPQVLGLANRLTPHLGGVEKTLRAVRPAGPEPELRGLASREAEAELVAGRIKELAETGVPYEEMALLYRVNARSEDWEQVFRRDRIPYVVRGGAFLRRPAARRLAHQTGRAVARWASTAAHRTSTNSVLPASSWAR